MDPQLTASLASLEQDLAASLHRLAEGQNTPIVTAQQDYLRLMAQLQALEGKVVATYGSTQLMAVSAHADSVIKGQVGGISEDTGRVHRNVLAASKALNSAKQ
jgi:hypothetical protein